MGEDRPDFFGTGFFEPAMFADGLGDETIEIQRQEMIVAISPMRPCIAPALDRPNHVPILCFVANEHDGALAFIGRQHFLCAIVKSHKRTGS